MELLTVIKCPASQGCGGARPNPSIIGFFMPCVVYSSPFMHCMHHYSAEGFAL